MHGDPRTEQVVPGLWSIPVPIPNNPLGYTLVYLFHTDRGPVIVDSGWNDDESWQRLSEGMIVAGCSVADTFGVLVTHVHNDHHGLSARVRDASGAWIAMHPADSVMLGKTAPSQEAARQFRSEIGSLLLEAGADRGRTRHPSWFGDQAGETRRTGAARRARPGTGRW